MNFLERVAKWVGLDINTVPSPEVAELRNVLDEGRQRKRTEMFDEALKEFDRALELAKSIRDRSAIPIVQLHRADVFIRQRRWDDALGLLNQLEHDARIANERIQQSYTLSTTGTLYQAQDDMPSARRYYEQALDIARIGKSAGAEGRALGHLADTYLLDGNASYAVHLLRDALVKLNASTDMELSSYFVGRLGEALIATGQESEGDQLLTRALRLAQHMNYRVFERQWHLALARRALKNTRYSDAFNHYERTLVMLRSQSKESAVVLREMGKTCMHLNRIEDALDYTKRALDLNPDDPLTQGIYGFVLHSTGKSAEALPYLRAAVAYGEQHPFPEFIETLRTLAFAQAESGETREALATFDKALVLAHHNGDRIEEARTYQDIGMYYARHEQNMEAIKAWSDAVNIYDSQGGYHSQLARLYCDIANLRLYSGLGQRALKDYESALMVLNSVQDYETRGVVLSNAANAYVDQGDIETADSFFTEAIKIAQRLQDRTAEATRRGNYGWFLLATGRIQRARTNLEEAHRQSETLGLKLPLAVQTDNLGLVYSELEQHDEALRRHQHALVMVESLDNPYWTAIIKCNLGMQLLKMGHTDEAAALFEEAYQNPDQYEVNTRALIGKAKVALIRDEIDIAGTIIYDAVMIARRAHTRRLLAEGLTVHSEQQAKAGNPEKAQVYWEEARKLLEVLHHPDANLNPGWLVNA